MVEAYHEIRSTLAAKPEVRDLRTAAYVVAISKVAKSYESLGIWP